MNRGITSAPMNWAIDYGQNRAGEIMGNAIGNTGNVLGNAIMQFAQDKRKREEKKAKEEAAARFILASGVGKAIGIKDEKGALEAVKGIGVDNTMGMIQLQQRQQQIEQDKARADAEALRLTNENNRLKLERETLGKFVSEATTPRMQLPSAGSVGAAFNTEGASIPRPTMQAPDPLAAFARNAQNMNPQAGLSALNQIIDAKGKPVPDHSQIGKEITLSDGRKAVWTSNGGIQVLDKPKDATAKADVKTLKIGNSTYHIGPGNHYFDEGGRPVSFGSSPGAAMAALVDALGVKPAPPPAPQAAPSAAPAPGTRAKQNGKTYEFNGRDWVEI